MEKKIKKESKSELEEKKKEEKYEESKYVIVVPGETIAEGDFLPGEGTRKKGKEIISSRFGLLEKSGNLIKVIPLGGAYMPRIGNTVIGQVIDINFNGWSIDILSPQLAFLPVSECSRYVNKNEMADYYSIGDIIVAKIKSIKLKGIDLTMRKRGLKKLDDGLIIKINPTRVPRIIGRAGSMVNMIKNETGCNIIVGQNGIIWIKGDDIESEMLTREAILQIVEKPFTEGLTEKIKEFLNEKKLKDKRKEKDKKNKEE